MAKKFFLEADANEKMPHNIWWLVFWHCDHRTIFDVTRTTPCFWCISGCVKNVGSKLIKFIISFNQILKVRYFCANSLTVDFEHFENTLIWTLVLVGCSLTILFTTTVFGVNFWKIVIVMPLQLQRSSCSPLNWFQSGTATAACRPWCSTCSTTSKRARLETQAYRRALTSNKLPGFVTILPYW